MEEWRQEGIRKSGAKIRVERKGKRPDEMGIG
jgi:hypothetical protein